jgi:O-antigen ligase
VSALIRRFLICPRQYVAAAAVALLLSVPFVLPVNGFPVPTFYQEWVVMALGCTAFLAILVGQGKTGVDVPRMVLLPLGILVLLLIQMAQGRLMYWQQGAVGAMYLLWSVAMLFVGRALRQQLGWEGFCRLAAWAVCAGALLSAVFGVLQLTGLQFGGLVVPMIGPRVHANLGQANHFANYLCLSLFATIYLACTRRLNAFAAGSAMVFLLALANFSGTRSVWLYLAAGALLALWAHHDAKSEQTRVLVMWAAAAIVTMLVLQLVTVFLAEESTFRHVTAGGRLSGVNATPSERPISWMAALLMFKSAPLAGVGFKGFAWNYFLSAATLPPGVPERITDNAHNLVFQFLAEFGLPGGILVIGAALFWWLPRFREKTSVHGWFVVVLVAIICLHRLLEYSLWYAYFLGPFALFVGAGDKPVWHRGPALSSRIVVAALCIGIVWTLASVYYDYRSVERLGVVAEFGSTRADVRRDAVSISGTTLFPDIVELGLSRTIVVDRNELEAKLDLNGRGLHAYPEADVAYRQSALLALSGELSAAYRLWDLAVASYPSQAAQVANALARQASTGEARLAPLVEYAASRTKEQ